MESSSGESFGGVRNAGVAPALREALADAGVGVDEVAARAGVALGTVRDVLGGRGYSSVETLRAIAWVCGLEMRLHLERDDDVVAAVRSLVDEAYSGPLTPAARAWAVRLVEEFPDDPVHWIHVAGQRIGLLHRPDATYLRIDGGKGVTIGDLVAAGNAGAHRWALSGAPALDELDALAAAPATTVMWTQAPDAVLAELRRLPLAETQASRDADLVLVSAPDPLFDGTRTLNDIVYVSPTQALIDSLALNDSTADHATEILAQAYDEPDY